MSNCSSIINAPILIAVGRVLNSNLNYAHLINAYIKIYTMKSIHILAMLAILSFCSCNPKPKVTNEIALGDTLTSESGLQYIYLKKGEGRKIETGSAVGTYLSLKVQDSLVWNTNELPDSLFTYVANYSRLIKGFTEMTMLLREGDEVIAILPDSLAYGAKGAGDIIPPHATLVYNQFKVISVGEPKLFLSDTLLAILKTKGADESIAKYKEITNGLDSTKYHTDNEQLLRVHDVLSKDEKHQLAFDFASPIADLTDNSRLKYKAAMSLEALGKVKAAKEILEKLLVKAPDNQQIKNKLKELIE